MTGMLTQIKMMYKPNTNRSMTALIIFHSWDALVSSKWRSMCRRMAARSLASFFNSATMASSSGAAEAESTGRPWRSLEEMTLGPGSAPQRTAHNVNHRGGPRLCSSYVVIPLLFSGREIVIRLLLLCGEKQTTAAMYFSMRVRIQRGTAP